jgi:hypothetical protein
MHQAILLKKRSTPSAHFSPVPLLRFIPHLRLFASLNSVVAGRGILSSVIATGVLGFITTILFLFCIPDLDTFFALDAPQPFVQVYALAFGKGPSIFMTIIAALGLIMVRGRAVQLSTL